MQIKAYTAFSSLKQLPFCREETHLLPWLIYRTDQVKLSNTRTKTMKRLCIADRKNTAILSH